MTQHPLSRLLTRLLAHLDCSEDTALRLGPDPRASRQGSLIASGWACPAPMLGYAGACGRSKTPEQDTCGRTACVRWASRQKTTTECLPRAPVVSINRGGRS